MPKYMYALTNARSRTGDQPFPFLLGDYLCIDLSVINGRFDTLEGFYLMGKLYFSYILIFIISIDFPLVCSED